MSHTRTPDWAEYHRATAITARFDRWVMKEVMSYVGLGVANEAGEVVAEVRLFLHDDGDIGVVRSRIVDELGDVLWYAARVAELVGGTLADAPVGAITLPYDDQPVRAVLLDACLGFVAKAGEVAGEIKKALRDDGGTLTVARKTRILDQLAGILAYGAVVAESVNATLGDAAEANVVKVRRRLANGTLGGSGDR